MVVRANIFCVREIKTQTYIDDLIALLKTSRHNETLKHSGMLNKGWIYSCDDISKIFYGESSESVIEKVLGT